VALKSALSPGARMRAQAGITTDERTFVVGEFLVRSVDLFSGQDVTCKSKDLASTEQFMINRSLEITLTIGEVKNHHLPYFEQTRGMVSRSYSAPKSQRMLINCNQCINYADPAFQYECSYMVNVLKCAE
jgi:hypothetical protein